MDHNQHIINMVKKYFLLIAIFPFIISSCVHLYFIEPQPEGGKLLSEVPTELHGEWYTEEGGIEIRSNGIYVKKIQLDTLTNKMDTMNKDNSLCDTFRLYKIKQFYVLNYRENNTPWEIVIISKQGNDIYLYGTTNPDLLSKDQNLKLKEARYSMDDKDTIVQALNPELEESSSFRSATFSGKMTLKTVKIIASEENIMNILKSDGSIYFPGNKD